MSSAIDTLAAAIRRAASPEEVSDRQSAESSLPVSPWAVWLLLGLIRHAQRQSWVGQVAVARLGADLDAISAVGALGHPSLEQTGLVPDLPEWEYYFHGRGCCLTNRITGEEIDVDFFDGSTEWFDDYFFIDHLRSLKQPSFVEGRLIALHPSLETVILAFRELQVHGLLEQRAESKVVRLHPTCRDWLELVDTIDASGLEPHTRGRVGCALCDWLLACENDSEASVAERAKQCVSERVRQLQSAFEGQATRKLALQALVDINVPEATAALKVALRDPPSGTISTALDIIQTRDQEDWTAEVFALLRRINPNGQVPEPYIWLKAAEYLLRRDRYVNDVRRGLQSIVHRELGEAALLALEFFPELAVPQFRKALRSSVPCDRTTAAAALAILDQPWSRAELIGAMNESDDQVRTSECRSALCALPHPDLHRLVREWESRNPHEPETGQFITMEEMQLRTRDSWIAYEMHKLHLRVLPLRTRQVSTEKRRWWPF